MNKGTLILNGINYSGNTIENNFYSSGAIISSDMTIINDLGLPEYPLSTSEEYYEAPQDGIFYLYADKATNGMTLIIQIEINNEWKVIASFPNYNQYGENGLSLPLKKKTKIRLRTDSNMQSWQVRIARFMYSNNKAIDISDLNKVHYDDTEREIGTWFGKKLYQKTIYIESLPNKGKITIDVGVNDIERVVNFFGTAVHKTNYGTLNINSPLTPADNLLTSSIRTYFLNKNTLEIQSGLDRSNFDCYITFQYIKND